MGQSVVALMYGIPSSTKGLRDIEGELFFDDHTLPKEKQLGYYDERAPRDAYEGDVLGFPVACSSGMDDGEGYLGESCLLSDIEKKHAKGIARAKKRWEMFAEWALKEHGKKLPKAALWLTTDERA